jgi:2-polyprenyl-3-methyl-5-hydroxy-6-metoxy-1,4-benzoquinol methylase
MPKPQGFATRHEKRRNICRRRNKNLIARHQAPTPYLRADTIQNTLSDHQNTSLRWRVAQWCERRWWQWYLRKRDPVSYLAWKQAYWQQFIQQIGLSTSDIKRAADLGCGPAGIYIAIPQAQVEAVDPLLESYAQDLAHFQPKNYPNVHFQAKTIEDWTAESAPFDTIFCINAINHVRDIAVAFERIAAVSEPHTTVVITTDAHRFGWLRTIFALAPGDILHPHQYTLEGYIALCKQAGLIKPECILLKREAIFDYYALVFRGA